MVKQPILKAGKGPRLLVISNEPPWPAVHGARVDQWNRFSGLKGLGWTLALLTWSTKGSIEPSAAELARMAEVFDDVQIVPKPHGLAGAVRRVSHLPFYSTHVSSRLLTAPQREEALRRAREFAPDGVFVDAIYGYPIGRAIAKALGVPLMLRSNNIEHRYMAMQARSAIGFKSRLQLALASLHLDRFETQIHREVDWNFDCSADDLVYWRGLGISNNSWAPPIFPALASADVSAVQDRDFVYMGNLYTPNNVAGLIWLFEQVLPKVLATGVRPSIIIAGGRPSDAVKAAVASYDGAELLANPDDAAAVRRRGRALLNPILGGSGINVKSIEMLFESVPVITTRIGVQGMSADVQAAFTVAADADDFAAAMLSALAGPVDVSAARRSSREQFGLQGLKQFSDSVLRVIGKSATGDDNPESISREAIS